jgi:integrase
VREFKNNSAGRLIKDLKAFLNWATDKGLNSNMDYKKKSFKKLREEPEIIYLTYEELLHLYNLELDKVTHENVRNVFCFGAFTGMRFSDIAAMTRENIHKDKIEYRIAKTDEVNTIPINKYVKAILNKYKKDVKPLPVYSEQKTNLYLKELAVIAELNRKIKITHFRGGERLVKIEPLNELITFHVSKKTFMTNFLSRGGSLETAMAIVGNKDYKTAKRYYKVVDSLKADEMKRVFG